MNDVEFHFALEGISGKGKHFLLSCIKEVKMFQKQLWTGKRLLEMENF